MGWYYGDWDEGTEGKHYEELESYKTPPDARVIPYPQSVSRRGGFGTEWWGKQWVAVLNDLAGEGRLDRGRTYARNGSVRRLEIARGMAYARVSGSRPKPYKTAVALNEFSDDEWEIVFEQLGSQLIYTAKLLAGEMPSDIEDLLREAGVSLFPRSLHDIRFLCSCPDGAVLCKHAAAIYYLLAEQIDNDPFVLFQLRGRTREQILSALRAGRSGQSGDKLSAVNFWTSALPLPSLRPPEPTEIPAIFAQLGDPPLPEQDTGILYAIYKRIAQQAQQRLNTLSNEMFSSDLTSESEKDRTSETDA